VMVFSGVPEGAVTTFVVQPVARAANSDSAIAHAVADPSPLFIGLSRLRIRPPAA